MATRRDNDLDRTENPDRNPDPITGAPGSHPIGTGVGAAGGGAAGAAIGAAIGAGATGPAAPIGAVVGAVVGAVAGGLAGKGAAEAVNPAAEDQYWRQNYASRPYYESNYTYEEDYRPAYQYGWSSRTEHANKNFSDVENDLERGWDKTKSSSRLGWDKAKHATRDAWDRLESKFDRDRNTGTTGSSGSLGAPQAYPGHTDERGEMPSAVSTTGRMSGSDLSSGFSGTQTAGMDDRTGGLMGTQIGGDTDVDNWVNNNRTRYAGRRFDDVETDLRRDWESSHRGESTWEKVKDSVRSGWHKVERALPGDADRDGR